MTFRQRFMRIKPMVDQISVVMLGRFNAAIFQPAWFAAHDMLGLKEAEAATIHVIHPEIAQFEVDEFQVVATPDRFAATSRTPHPEHIKDLIINCFGAHLPHTPILAMGINRMVHFDAGDFEVQDRVGSKLAPKEPWGEWGKQIEGAPRDQQALRGGLLSLTMKQGQRPDGRKGHVQATVEPSAMLPASGIFVQVNDHYDLGPHGKDAVASAAAAMAVLEAEWGASLQRSAFIIDQVMALAEECRNVG